MPPGLDDLMEIAGRLNMSEDEFEVTTPRFFYNRQRGHYEAEEGRQREAWERARWLALYTVMPHSTKTLKLTDLTIFPWETGYPVLTAETKAQWDEELKAEWEKWRKELAESEPPIEHSDGE